MAQPTGQSYRMNGPAIVYTGTGSAGAGEQLGISVDGVDIRIERLFNPIQSDAAGGAAAEFQHMGSRATIRMRLVAFDDAVMQKCISRGDRTTAGLENTPGVLVHTNSYGFKVGIQSGQGVNTDNPWYFPTCTLNATPVGAKLGSRNTEWDLEFIAIPFVPGTATTAKDIALFSRAFPGGFPS